VVDRCTMKFRNLNRKQVADSQSEEDMDQEEPNVYIGEKVAAEAGRTLEEVRTRERRNSDEAESSTTARGFAGEEREGPRTREVERRTVYWEKAGS